MASGSAAPEDLPENQEGLAASGDTGTPGAVALDKQCCKVFLSPMWDSSGGRAGGWRRPRWDPSRVRWIAGGAGVLGSGDGVGDPLLDCGFPFPPSLAVHLPAEEAAGPEAAITTKFSAKVDMSRIWACRQNREETVNDYYHRLEKVFIENSGIIKQEAGVGVWETHLSNAFLTGLSPAISSSVRNSCIGVMDGARLEEIRRHAVQAEKRLSEEKASEEKRRRARKEKAQLTMVQVVTTTGTQGDGQGRGNRRGGRDRNRDRNSRCYNCGEMGHRFAECPHEKQKKNFRSDKSDCNKDNSSN
ncbi:uncharacterized protein LOC117552038 isoform X3 [Gymnodraco acuticeps]|uniref:Uncharacterized protein LOC117552038 isoform X3 n=1 Tax=Gymnodraco acuticeps TaxID=8218 RepID=A0A6P8W0C8_GYMAC|nr:uncharacterized protein LOC117552038 isoform X3 [Gymnodraco acuticeps]